MPASRTGLPFLTEAGPFYPRQGRRGTARSHGPGLLHLHPSGQGAAGEPDQESRPCGLNPRERSGARVPTAPASLDPVQSPSRGPARTQARRRRCPEGGHPDAPFSSAPPVLKREPFTRLPHSFPRRRDDGTEAKKDQGGKESPEQELETQARHPGKFPLRSAARARCLHGNGAAWRGGGLGLRGTCPPTVLPPPPVDSVLTDAF